MAKKRTELRSTAGKKLYAVRDDAGKFEDIQSFQKAHSQDIKRTSKDELAKKPQPQSKKANVAKSTAKAAPAKTPAKPAAVKKSTAKAAVKPTAVVKTAVKKATVVAKKAAPKKATTKSAAPKAAVKKTASKKK